MNEALGSNPVEDGAAFCAAQPGLLVAAVWREAMKFYPSREDQAMFVNGYIDARRKVDENRRETD